ncbi:MAG: helix-turn-helix domain-containing protein [Candidatus Parcubacteria bacterium]|nr:helix-turn-helix domain-containing protein [Candidatus Parcubacteria bacterium]
MDEILIGEKKYVSSKQAAKVTGYAKDYVGQLCREGRVPARLVGRSWYVLESALHDHRFGNPKNEAIEDSRPTTWESPRYEASDAENLPSVNRLRGSESSELTDDTQKEIEVAQRLQDSWAAWFDRFDHATEPAVIAVAAPEKPKDEPVETTIEIEPEVSIPIRTVYQPQQTIQEEIKLDKVGIQLPSVEKEVRVGGGRIMRTMQMFGIVFAMAIATIAVIGSGYVDSYVLSNRQAQLIAGVAVYNK